MMPLLFGSMFTVNFGYVELKTNGLNQIAVFAQTLRNYIADQQIGETTLYEILDQIIADTKKIRPFG